MIDDDQISLSLFRCFPLLLLLLLLFCAAAALLLLIPATMIAEREIDEKVCDHVAYFLLIFQFENASFSKRRFFLNKEKSARAKLNTLKIPQKEGRKKTNLLLPTPPPPVIKCTRL